MSSQNTVYADAQAIVDDKYRPAGAVYVARNRSPARLADAAYVATSNAAYVVTVAGGAVIAKLSKCDRRDRRGREEIFREILFGAAHAGRTALPHLVPVFDFWTLPSPVSLQHVLSPLRHLDTDWTIAMADHTAYAVRLAAIQAFWNQKRAKYGTKVPSKYAEVGAVLDEPSPAAATIDRVYDGIVRPTMRAGAMLMVASEQPTRRGMTLGDALSQQGWREHAALLRRLFALLAELQSAAQFQHGDLSPQNVIVDAEQRLHLIDLARSSSAYAPAIAPATGSTVETFDLRFLGVWLARELFSGRYVQSDGLRLVAAALVAPSHALVDAAVAEPTMQCLTEYPFHGVHNQQLGDYVGTLATVAEALTASVRRNKRLRRLCDNLMWDVGPWTAHLVATNRLAAATHPDDLANPLQAVRLDVLAN
jgi:hypothetical protein